MALTGGFAIARAELSNDIIKYGRYTLAATPAELAERERVIELAVKEFFFFARPIARSTLESKTRIAPALDMHRNRDQFTVEFEGYPPMTGSLSTPSHWRSPEEEDFMIELRLDEVALIQIVHGAIGTRINRFRPDPEGVLVLDIDIMSPKLSAPLRYSLTYRMHGTNTGMLP